MLVQDADAVKEVKESVTPVVVTPSVVVGVDTSVVGASVGGGGGTSVVGLGGGTSLAQRPSSHVYPVGQLAQAFPALYISAPKFNITTRIVNHLWLLTRTISTFSVVADN